MSVVVTAVAVDTAAAIAFLVVVVVVIAVAVAVAVDAFAVDAGNVAVALDAFAVDAGIFAEVALAAVVVVFVAVGEKSITSANSVRKPEDQIRNFLRNEMIYSCAALVGN